MELRQLTYFLAIVRAGSLSQAALSLAIEQPALSRSLRALEAELGLKLVHRHGRGIRLTERGHEFHAAILPLVQKLGEIRSATMAKASASEGTITLGLSPAISAAIGLPLVKGFSERFPEAVLQLVTSYSGHLGEWLLVGRLDIAVLNGADLALGAQAQTLCRVELLHVAHRDLLKPGAWNDSAVTLEAALATPVVLPTMRHGLRRQLAALARERGRELVPLAELDTQEMIRQAVYSRLAGTIMPYATLIRETGDHELVVRHIVEPSVAIDYVLACSPRRPVSPIMREIVSMIRAEIQRTTAEGLLSSRG